MTRETVSKSIKLNYHTNSIKPSEINEQFLKDNKLLDKENQLDMDLIRVGSIGTSFTFINESEDEINIQQNHIEIKTNNQERMQRILLAFKNMYSGTIVRGVEYNFDLHLISENYPDEIFNKYLKTTLLKLDALQFKKDNFALLVYSCGRNRIHLVATSEIMFRKKLADFDIIEMMKIDELNRLVNDFITKELEIQ